MSVFQTVPLWLAAGVLELLCIAMMHFLRDVFEGLPYNVSLASEYGDQALIVAVLIGLEVSKRQVERTFFQSTTFVGVALVLTLVVTLVANKTFLAHTSQIADWYHNIFVMPLFVLLLCLAIPMVIQSGRTIEQVAALTLVWFWVMMFVCDVCLGRLDQRKWLENHGFKLEERGK